MAKGTSISVRSTARVIEAAVDMRLHDAQAADELSYMGRVLVLTTLPHSDPGDVKEYVRTNGDRKLVIQPGPLVGVPYGSIPRLVLAWVTTEAVRTKQRRIVLGDSLSSFMQQLGMVPTGGRWGSITRLKDQMKRLFSARIAAVQNDAAGYHVRTMEIATDVDLWWMPKNPDQAAIWQSVVVLSDRFFDLVTDRPVPVDMRALKALKQSPLGLDFYMWLTYRVSYLQADVEIPWALLHEQFGADYASVHEFTRKAKRELEKIATFWPALRYATPRGRLVLRPSTTHVPKLKRAE